MTKSQDNVRIIKKYPNRRLYDSHTSSHVTLVDIRRLVQEQEPFQVVDAKSGEDITRSILLQIIQEAESDGNPIFSSTMLKNIICFYGPFQGVLGSYLDESIQSVIDIQTQTGSQSSQAWTDFMQGQAPIMQDMMRQYVEQSRDLYMNTQNMFGLFGGFAGSSTKSKDAPSDAQSGKDNNSDQDTDHTPDTDAKK
ncbi:polyhydroxyalkanoate synthesis repressor PhaR [Oceanisphaera sp. W20_SRM_FM3]|uniref:polyhydroxyalkanoate synthesis repressor PhaR n=1 Tax=Oceanisphaera sp. W20_SRM_FM3 TaxID=3240267 RepID=UPI003F967152